MAFRGTPSRLSELIADLITGARWRTRESGARIEVNTGDIPLGEDGFVPESTIGFYTADPDEDGLPIPGRIGTSYNDPSDDGIGWSRLRIDGPQLTSGANATIEVGQSTGDFGATGRSLISLDAEHVQLRLGGEISGGDTNTRKIVHDTDWTTLTPVNGWVSYGGSFAPTGYRILNGVLYFRGAVKNGTAALGCYGLHPDIANRIIGTRQFQVRSSAAGTTSTMEVRTDGTMILVENIVGGPGAFYFLDAAFIPLDQD